MEKGIFKERFEYIIGFLALVISLSNFKEELKGVIIGMPYFSFSLWYYFLVIILTSIFCLHLYFIPQFIQKETKFWLTTKKLVSGLSYAIFFLIIISPFVMAGLYLVAKIPFGSKGFTVVALIILIFTLSLAFGYAINLVMINNMYRYSNNLIAKSLNLDEDNDGTISIVERIDETIAHLKEKIKRNKNNKSVQIAAERIIRKLIAAKAHRNSAKQE
jgi:hypothetical protein